MPIPDGRVSRTSLALLRSLLLALDAADTAIAELVAGLPMPCIRLPELAVVLCATPISSAHMFRSRAVAAACERELDVVIVRHGSFPESLDDVSIDVALYREPPLDVIIALVSCRATEGGLWLVPARTYSEDSVRLAGTGLTISVRPRYRGRTERSAGMGSVACSAIRDGSERYSLDLSKMNENVDRLTHVAEQVSRVSP